jgi:hypothetical protein
MGNAMQPVVGGWLKLLELAREQKKKDFQEDADECMRFLDGPYDWLYAPRGSKASGFDFDAEELPGPSVRMTVNKTAELVQLFGPALYHRNPVRKVNPRKTFPPPIGLYGDVSVDPQAGMMFQQDMAAHEQATGIDVVRAELLERYLNYTPSALDLKNNSRWMITEALIKGAGCLWHKPHRPAGATQQWAGSFYHSIDDLQMDPDASTFADVKWVAKRCVKPTWEVERMYGLPEGSLRPTEGMESYTAQASVQASGDDYRRRQGRTADLTVYWEIYSKMGLGGRLAGIDPAARARFDGLGDYVYIVMAEGVPYPLNLPPPFCDAFGEDAALAQELLPEVQRRTAWETPFWADNGWPVTLLSFHWKPGKLWPISHLKPGIGELKFINWAWSFLAQKVRIASRDFIAIAKAAGEDLKEKIKHGGDYTILEVEALQGSIDSVVKFLQHPGFNPEIYKVIEAVSYNFERRVGLTELMYGQTGRQLRSAQEANIKSDAVNVRPDDMAATVEDAMTDVAKKEAFVARWHLTGQDILRALGPVAARLWDQLLVPSDPAALLYQLEYRIEANSMRKPNKAADAENMQQATQMLLPLLFQYAQATGQVNQLNALITDWAKANDLDAERYLFEPPPPPPPPPPPGAEPAPEGPPPEGVAA